MTALFRFLAAALAPMPSSIIVRKDRPTQDRHVPALLISVGLAGLGSRSMYWMMKLWSAIARLLTVLAVVGLVGGGIVAPAKAESMMDAAAMTLMAADGMECCDPPSSAANDCRDMKACPLAAICSLKCPQSLASAEPMQTRLALAARMPAADDQVSSGLSPKPLGHPPKA